MQVAHLLESGLLSSGIKNENITVAPTYQQALEIAFAKAQPGDFLVVESYYGLKRTELEELLKKTTILRERELYSV